MKNRLVSTQEKEGIITEYLTGNISFRNLGKKHKLHFRTIHFWVSEYQGMSIKKRKPKKAESQSDDNQEIPTDIKQLQESLRQEKLKNKLLNTMIDIAEDQLKIDIRKKSGTKR